MLVLKIVYNKEMDFAKELQNMKDSFDSKNISIGIVEMEEGSSRIIKIMCDDTICNNAISDKIYLYVSNILFNVVIEEYRKKELYDYITENYFFLKQEEILDIEKNIIDVLEMRDRPSEEIFIYCYNKMHSIIDKIKSCIGENETINFNGFITFRMRELREDVESIVDKIIEKYIIDKEYEEFIRLLKYFVEIQECKMEEIRIKITSCGLYVVEDQDGNDMLKVYFKELADTELNIVDANIEDILISGLITSVPNKIKIYGYENCNNKEFIRTLENVFEDRIIFCENSDKYKISKNKVLTE